MAKHFVRYRAESFLNHHSIFVIVVSRRLRYVTCYFKKSFPNCQPLGHGKRLKPVIITPQVLISSKIFYSMDSITKMNWNIGYMIDSMQADTTRTLMCRLMLAFIHPDLIAGIFSEPSTLSCSCSFDVCFCRTGFRVSDLSLITTKRTMSVRWRVSKNSEYHMLFRCTVLSDYDYFIW